MQRFKSAGSAQKFLSIQSHIIAEGLSVNAWFRRGAAGKSSARAWGGA